jgi:hypothetical protein
MHCYLHALIVFHYSLLNRRFRKAMCYKIYDSQFGHHLSLQSRYRMSSVCCRSEVGRLLLRQLTEETDLPL